MLASHTTTAVRPRSAKPGATLERTAAFEATSYFSDPTPLTPPNTQVAAGSTYVVEALNDDITVWSRTGDLVQSTDPNSLFGVPAGYRFGEPRLVYDVSSQRWFLSGWASDSADDSIVYVAVVGIIGPERALVGVSVRDHDRRRSTDQPKLGVSDDKVVLSWNDYTNGSTVSGQETWVCSSRICSPAASVRYFTFLPDPTRFDIVPVDAVDRHSTEYLGVQQHVRASTAGRGPGVHRRSRRSASSPSPASPPTTRSRGTSRPRDDPDLRCRLPAAQPNGGSIETERRPVAVGGVAERNAVGHRERRLHRRRGRRSRACASSRSTRTEHRPCRSTPTSRSPGADLYYPAVTLDRSGNPYVVATVSSASI